MAETIASLRARLRARLANPRDVDTLLADVTGRTQAWLFAHGDESIDAVPLETLVARRRHGEPLQYIRGHVEFFGRDFFVDDRVLIPRPETELLVEAAIARAPHGADVLDIGSGSGCIAISLACERTDLRVFSTDLSPAALVVASRNARLHAAPVLFAASDVFDGIGADFQLIVSNPPYIAEDFIATLTTEVRDHEPRIALTPGPQGTEIIERILTARRGAMVILEIAFGQLAGVRRIAGNAGYLVAEVINDLADIERIAVLTREG
jgi:release factor glutamine methyltransferase